MDNSPPELIALILCAEDKPRNQSLEYDLMELGIDYEIVTGSTPTVARKHYEKHFDSRLSYSVMSDEQLAGTYGHHLMFKRAKVLGATNTIFFEDDCVIDLQGFKNLIRDIDFYPKGVLLLGACGGFTRRKKYTSGETFWGQGVGDTVAGAHCYILEKNLLDSMIEYSRHLQMLADSFCRPPDIKLFVSKTYVTWQMKEVKSFIPLGQSIQSKNPIRQFASSLKDDVFDRINFGIWGGRTLRLSFLERFACLFFTKLPGCKD
jgi:hypothetical protein